MNKSILLILVAILVLGFAPSSRADVYGCQQDGASLSKAREFIATTGELREHLRANWMKMMVLLNNPASDPTEIGLLAKDIHRARAELFGKAVEMGLIKVRKRGGSDAAGPETRQCGTQDLNRNLQSFHGKRTPEGKAANGWEMPDPRLPAIVSF